MSYQSVTALAEPVATGFIGQLRENLPELAGKAVKSLVEEYSQPKEQAYLFGCFIGAATSTSVGMRFIPSVLFTYVCGLAARQAYLIVNDMREDLRAIAEASKDRA